MSFEKPCELQPVNGRFHMQLFGFLLFLLFAFFIALKIFITNLLFIPEGSLFLSCFFLADKKFQIVA